ncbi:unnamed protein product [Allacma fusca]|uniref:Uncharacterized protein n=1 Tax=Allacma fusca TaxID=39272 RepID=A0A8J2JPM8_9HEXA|nr:unnamed protein product [Allacma fusca]
MQSLTVKRNTKEYHYVISTGTFLGDLETFMRNYGTPEDIVCHQIISTITNMTGTLSPSNQVSGASVGFPKS